MTMQIINPYNNTVVETIETSSQQDVADAVGRAVNVKDDMAHLPAWQKADILTRAAAIISEREEPLAQNIVQSVGKIIRHARSEVKRCVETFGFAADAARNLHGETIPMDAARTGVGKIGWYVRVPVGVIGAITPFNFPLNLVAHKVAPAIAAGCPIVLKPSPPASLTALALKEILAEAGLPDGAFEVLIGDIDVGKWLTTDERIAMLTFTGSPPVAKAISRVAGLRRTTFELGGNAAVILEKDAELSDATINRLLVAAFAYSGQVCISLQRMYVHVDIYDEVKRRLVAGAAALRLGDPMKNETDIGPVISDQAAARVRAWVGEAVEQGAFKFSSGEDDGRMLRPVILENVSSNMRVMREEVFGPVLCLIPYANLDEAIDAVNDSPYGLQAGIYTQNITAAMRAVDRLHVGGVMINDAPIFRVDQMPYGGVKNSGLGREGPRFAVEEMTELKMVVVKG